MADIHVFETDDAEVGVLADVRRLLDEAFEGDFADDDWQHCLGGWHVVVMDDGEVVSHAAVVARRLDVADEPVSAGYVEAVATAPARQRSGFGSIAMTALATVLRAEFELGALSTDRPAFYERLGWQRWRGPTFVRTSSGLVRTADEDDGIMVLRFGRSEGVDVTAAIACEQRPGDDW